MRALSGLALKFILAVSVSLFHLLFCTSLYAGDGQVVAPSSHPEILNQNQSVGAAHSGRGAWLQFASADDDYHDDDDDDRYEDDDDDRRNCKRRDRRGKCRPYKKLKVRNLHKLQFGKVILGQGSRGTVTINPANGNKTVTGAYNGGGRHGPAEFEIKGEPEKRFLVVFPGDITLSGSNGSELKVSRFVGFFSENRGKHRNGRVVGKLGRDGKALLLVGGTVKISPNHGYGNMFGPADIFVEYIY